MGENWRWVAVEDESSSDEFRWPLGFSGTSVAACVDIRLVGTKGDITDIN